MKKFINLAKEKLNGRIILIFIFSLFWANSFFFSKTGLISYIKLKRELVAEQARIEKIEKKILLLKNEIDDWQKYEYSFEQMARNELNLTLPDEKVFLY